MAANLTGLFGQLNDAILRNPLNEAFDFSVAGMEERPMDSVNPMLQQASAGLGSAFGIDPESMMTSQASDSMRKAKHRKAVVERARAMGLEDVAKGLEAGGEIKDYLPQILAEEKKKTASVISETEYQRSIKMEDLKAQHKIQAADVANQRTLAAAHQKMVEKRAGRGTVKANGKVYMTDGLGNVIGVLGVTDKEHARVMADKKEDMEKEAEDFKDLSTQAQRAADVTANIEEVRDLMTRTTPGLVAKGQSMIKGTDAFAADVSIKSLQYKMGLDQMLKLKEESATGSTGFGQLSEKELDLLLNALAPLDIGMDAHDLERNLATIEKFYAPVMAEWEARGGVKKVGAMTNSTKTVEKTGTAPDGRKVTVYTDGTVEYK
jgi:hypothetical protein